MRLRTAVINHLLAAAAVTDQVGQRVRPGKAVQGEARPFIVVRSSRDVPGYHMTGRDGISDAVIDLVCAGSNETESAAVALIVSGLAPFAGVMGGGGGVEVRGCWVVDQRDEDARPGAAGDEIGWPATVVSVRFLYRNAISDLSVA